MHYNLSDVDSIANRFLLSLRDKSLQVDRQRFRNSMQRLGSIMAYEISKKLAYRQTVVETPLGQSRINIPKQDPVLVTILRAGLPFFNGFQEFFDQSDSGFIGAYRQEGEGSIKIKLDYAATPITEGREVILIDPMLATGRSAMDAINIICKKTRPAHIHLACMVASPEGLKYAGENLLRMNIPHTIWSFAVDERLDERFYIVPGLGDAGDLSFGPRLS
ncbi:MAG TPA: uracil phosphoribosyltransferase [Cyclobacteriaceae bacterium]|nr:uracil phosphoribosyltransferase [Cyclobacteriaceae bacterium]